MIESFLDLLADRVEFDFECKRDCKPEPAFRERWEKRDAESSAWRRDRLAEWIGFKYRSKRRTPDVPDLDLQKRFRHAIRQAGEVNDLRFRGGKSASDYRRDCVERVRSRTGTSARPGSCQSSLSDPSNLLAILRLISVVEALNAAIASDRDAKFPIKFNNLGGRGGPKGLDELLDRFDQVVPGPQEIAARAALWVGPNGKELLRRRSGDICADRKDDIFEYGKCEFLHLSAGAIVEEMIAHFITARVSRGLPAYRDSERPIDQFLQVSLAGCGFTRCRFEIRKREKLSEQEKQAFLQSESHKPADSERDSRLVCARDVSRYVAKFSLNYRDGLGEKYSGRLAQFVSDTDESVPNELYSEIVELYSACMLRTWLDSRRNDLVVYGVSPRVGGVVNLQGAERRSNIGAAGASKYVQDLSVSLGRQSESQLDEASVMPLVIGFSQITRKGESLAKARHETVFGWVVRSVQSADGTWKAGHHRLAAVVSVPSWWKRLEFVVTACWASPSRGRGLGQELLADPLLICSDPDPKAERPDQEAKLARTSTLKREFRIQLPRKAEDVTSRFDFDFIKTPYFDANLRERFARNNGPIKLEVGRKGRIVLSGERLWRGTVVTLGEQPADNIVVLPDMKGVIAEFNCVNAPPGEDHIERFKSPSQSLSAAVAQGAPPAKQQLSNRKPKSLRADVTVWTSEGRTSQGVYAQLLPFVQRVHDEKPCFALN